MTVCQTQRITRLYGWFGSHQERWFQAFLPIDLSFPSISFFKWLSCLHLCLCECLMSFKFGQVGVTICHALLASDYHRIRVYLFVAIYMHSDIQTMLVYTNAVTYKTLRYNWNLPSVSRQFIQQFLFPCYFYFPVKVFKRCSQDVWNMLSRS